MIRFINITVVNTINTATIAILTLSYNASVWNSVKFKLSILL